MPIRLLVVDDHNLFRRGLTALLAQDRRFQVVAEASDASQALTRAREQQPDLVLLDNHMPGVRGIDAIADLKEECPGLRVLMLTVSEDVEDLAAGLRAGAEGYLLKTINTEELCDSIQRVWEGDTIVSPDMMGKLVGLLRATPAASSSSAVAGGVPGANPDAGCSVSAPAAPRGGAPLWASIDPNDPIHSLSPRETEILRLIVRGDSNKLIARALDIAETTVKIHVQHILRKLNLNNRVHAAVYASERGLS